MGPKMSGFPVPGYKKNLGTGITGDRDRSETGTGEDLLYSSPNPRGDEDR